MKKNKEKNSLKKNFFVLIKNLFGAVSKTASSHNASVKTASSNNASVKTASKNKKASHQSASVKKIAKTLHTTTGKLYRFSRDTDSHYRRVLIPKASGGTRVLNTPQHELKSLQRSIARHLLASYELSPYATAYRSGISLKDNASPHVGHRYLLKMDICDFFGSITFGKVLSSVFPSTRYPKHVGVMLTAICCKGSVLPQGAPTSPAISNIVMNSFDNTLGKWCNKHGITYTRYCDDLTFSANTPLADLYLRAEDMLLRWGFTVNHNKTHFILNSSRQSVTGLVVNQKVTVPSSYKRELRQELYYTLKFGPDDAVKRSDIAKKRHLDASQYLQCLLGRVGYVLQIEPQNAWFIQARKQLKALANNSF